MAEMNSGNKDAKTIRIALAGNPNTGKTVLFNALTGLNQTVGNWPGVTVEQKIGALKNHKEIELVDLPGVYSLSPYSPEEMVARTFLLDERPEAIINIIDGTNLERNLYLTTQLVEIGLPVIIAINMADVLEKRNIKIDTERLAREFHVKVCMISALKGDGIDELIETAFSVVESKTRAVPKHIFGGAIEHTIAHIEEALLHDEPADKQRWYAIKIFERDEKIIEALQIPQEKLMHVEQDIKDCEAELDDDSVSIITNERYEYVTSIIEKCIDKNYRSRVSISEKIDRVVTNRWLALPIFALIIFAVYYIAVSSLGTILTDWTNDVLFGEWIIPGVENFLENINCVDWLASLISEGIVGGVGAVLGFVPQLMLLFILLSILENCGYMARIAFILDRLFCRFGLSGKSFIPVLIGTGCGVPGIMSSRAIENKSAREITIMTTTFIPCSAKLPIIALIAGAVFGGNPWIAPAAYFIGIAAIIVSGIILKKLKHFRGEAAPFIMELPAYHIPQLKATLRTMWENTWGFIKRAGTVILLATIVIWFLSNFGFVDGHFGMVEDLSDGLLATVGTAIAWIFAPLGWGTWAPTVATFTGWLAKEEVVSTLAVLFGSAASTEAGLYSLIAEFFTPLSGFSFLVFNLLCAPCFAAMGAIKKEMNDGKMTAFAITYQMLFAYAIALCIYQFGLLFSGAGFGIGAVAAIVVLVALIYLLVHPVKDLPAEATK